MNHLAAMEFEPPAAGPAPVEVVVTAGGLACLLVVLLALLVWLVFVIRRYERHMAPAEAHIRVAEEHMARVEGLLTRIAEAAEGQPGAPDTAFRKRPNAGEP